MDVYFVLSLFMIILGFVGIFLRAQIPGALLAASGLVLVILSAGDVLKYSNDVYIDKSEWSEVINDDLVHSLASVNACKFKLRKESVTVYSFCDKDEFQNSHTLKINLDYGYPYDLVFGEISRKGVWEIKVKPCTCPTKINDDEALASLKYSLKALVNAIHERYSSANTHPHSLI